MAIVEDLRRGGGCLRRRDLVHGPAAARELDRLLEAGAVHRVGRGVYALPGADEDAVVARLAGGLLTCVSAAVHLGLPLLTRPTGAHVVVHSSCAAPQSRMLPASTTVHWDGRLDPACGLTPAPSRYRCEPAVVAPVALALVNALGCIPFRDVVALWDAALNRSIVERTELASLRPARRGRCTFDAALRATDGRSQSLPETFLRLGLTGAGLTVEPQALLEGVGFVDFLVERLLIVEVDGYAYHTDRRAFGEDRRRDREALTAGVPTVRFTFGEAVFGTRTVVSQVAGTIGRLRAAGAVPVDPRMIASRARRP